MATNREKVRMLIRDNVTPYTWTDAELDIFLEIEGTNLYRVAANVLRAWARDSYRLAVTYRMSDGKYMNKKSIVETLLALAAQYDDLPWT
jgi:hypothetical protein